MRKENAAKEKEQKEAARALEQIEAKARRSYQKDLEAFRDSRDSSAHVSKACDRIQETAKSASVSSNEEKDTTKSQGGPPPGLVASSSLKPKRSGKGAPSSIAITKRKRVNEKPKVVSKEEEAALKAREAAKKRMEEREKPMLGLYKSY